MAATYWRLTITATGGEIGGSEYVGLAGWTLFNTDNDEVTPVPFSGGTLSASSVYSAEYAAAYAIDADPLTAWFPVADGLPAWIQYQFPTAQDVTGFLLRSNLSIWTGGAHLQSPKDFKLQSSNNGTTWTDELSYTAVTWTTDGVVGGEVKTFSVSFPTRAAVLFPRCDLEDGGPYRIIEPVTRLNAVPPEPRRVRLCDQVSGRVVREQWSDPDTGEVDFQYLREGPWVLYALDHTLEHEAVAISDRLATADGARP
jgi:hypothetical protein